MSVVVLVSLGSPDKNEAMELLREKMDGIHWLSASRQKVGSF